VLPETPESFVFNEQFVVRKTNKQRQGRVKSTFIT
jgi:hypothetical protein